MEKVQWRAGGALAILCGDGRLSRAPGSAAAGAGPGLGQIALRPGREEAEILAKRWSEWQDLNLRPPRPKRGVLLAQPCNRVIGDKFALMWRHR